MRMIATDRLRLTPVTVETAPALWELLQLPELREFQDLPNVGRAGFTAMVAKRPKHLSPGETGRFEWLIYLYEVRRAVGWVSLRVIDRESNAGEIGYSVASEYRNEGIATEAVRALVTEAFVTAHLESISAYCLPANVASRRVLEHLGFAGGELVHHGASVAGRPVDVVHCCVHREAWVQSANSIDIPASA